MRYSYVFSLGEGNVLTAERADRGMYLTISPVP